MFTFKNNQKRVYTRATQSNTRRRRSGPRRNVVVIQPRNRGRVRQAGFYGRYSGTNAPERKFFDLAKTTTTVGAGGTVLSPSINLVKQGNGECEMIGRKFAITSIQLRMKISKVQESNATITNIFGTDSYRIVLVLDKQANGAAGTIAEIFQGTNIFTYNQMENSTRFSILKEWKGALHSPLNFAGGAVPIDKYMSGQTDRYLKWYKKCKIPIEMAPNAGARVIADVKSNNLMIVGFSFAGIITVNYDCRIRYADL